MDWQQTTALSIVGATAGIFAWAKFRRRQVRFGHGGHCGCAADSGGVKGSILYSARKGERPRVTVKLP